MNREQLKDDHIMLEIQEENERLAEIDRQKAEIIKKEQRWATPAFLRRNNK